MPLVDYPPSDDDADDDESGSQTRTNAAEDAAEDAGEESGMPPLPEAFHDLYASTVRRSVFDDPSLHQGRKRQTPHVVGHWPTHLYIEWHPSTSQYDLLSRLVQQVEEKLDRRVPLHNFLTSDLGTPLPLHISLSRPLALDTARKDDFLDKVSSAIKACHMDAFSVSPKTLAWYRSPDSNRTFLVLRVASGRAARRGAQNPELVALLAACNAVASRFEQPVLYQRRREESEAGEGDLPDLDAFHVSIGWTFGLAAEDVAAGEALEVFERSGSGFERVRDWEIDVAGVKAKIGNVVSHVPLVSRQSSSRSSLFGI